MLLPHAAIRTDSGRPCDDDRRPKATMLRPSRTLTAAAADAPFRSCPASAWRALSHQTLDSEISPSTLQTNSIIAATKHRIFEITLSASGNGSAGNANPKAAQTANTANIPATA